MQFSSASCYFLTSSFKYSPHHSAKTGRISKPEQGNEINETKIYANEEAFLIPNTNLTASVSVFPLQFETKFRIHTKQSFLAYFLN
jgi:hypothetical protein